MSKCAKWRAGGLILCVLSGLSASGQSAVAEDTPGAQGTSALSGALLDRAQSEVVRIRALVEQGTLPKSLLEQAEARLADAQDQAILTATLYGIARLQDMTPQQAAAMVEAAQRRVDRQSRVVAERQKLLDGGIISRSEFTSFENELDSRNRVLELAQNRSKLLVQLQAMAETEQQFERAAHTPAEVLIRYDGNGLFSLGDLPTIASEFEKRFHHVLPISALGQTLVHQSMGLDHRNRVDVALNPDQAEGIWLRQLLEKLRVPYIAFRSAMAGAATAPHIHIGPGSTRLKLAAR